MCKYFCTYVDNVIIDIFTCGSVPYLGVVMLEVVLHRVGVVVLGKKKSVSDRQHEPDGGQLRTGVTSMTAS
jgi:hypothetical protein